MGTRTRTAAVTDTRAATTAATGPPTARRTCRGSTLRDPYQFQGPFSGSMRRSSRSMRSMRSTSSGVGLQVAGPVVLREVLARGLRDRDDPLAHQPGETHLCGRGVVLPCDLPQLRHLADGPLHERAVRDEAVIVCPGVREQFVLLEQRMHLDLVGEYRRVETLPGPPGSRRRSWRPRRGAWPPPRRVRRTPGASRRDRIGPRTPRRRASGRRAGRRSRDRAGRGSRRRCGGRRRTRGSPRGSWWRRTAPPGARRCGRPRRRRTPRSRTSVRCRRAGNRVRRLGRWSPHTPRGRCCTSSPGRGSGAPLGMTGRATGRGVNPLPR